MRHHGQRFDKVRDKPATFLIYWLVQALWVTITGLPVWCTNAVANDGDEDDEGSLSSLDYIGLGLFAFGFSVEVIADAQKEAFKARKTGKWIDEGLWRLSQHPNYFGEITLWTGLSLVSISGSKTTLGSILPAVTPAFVFWLLTRLSGVPLLRRGNMKKWGHEAGYRKYMRETPLLIPWPR